MGALDQFCEHTSAILGVQERDAGPSGPAPGLGVQHPDTGLAHVPSGPGHIGRPEGDVVYPLAVAVEDLRDGGVLPGRLQKLQISSTAVVGAVDPEHGLPHALLLVHLLVLDLEPVGAAVEVDGSIEVTTGDTDVVKSRQSAEVHVGRRCGTQDEPPGGRVSGRRCRCRPSATPIASRPSTMPGSVIVGAARTPTGRLLGSRAGFSAAALGGFAIKAAVERAGIGGDQAGYVVMGQVLQAGAGQIPSRQAAVKAGIPMDVPSVTINKVCLSGLDAIALADQLISAGEFDVVVAGGMESMTNAPHLMPKSRKGYKYGSIEVLDATEHDGLTDPFEGDSMGASTERHNGKLGIGRPEQDAFAARSHQRAAAAQEKGFFDDEIVPVEIPQRKGDPVVFDRDEGVRADTTAEGLAKLRPAFDREGTITAGSSSQISDGAAAVVVMSRAKAEELGAPVLAEVGAHGNVAGPDNSLHSQPSNAIKHALGKAGKDVADLDLVEINEAFASVGLQSTQDLGISDEIVNVNGGAIALGHPIGASGARIALHLVNELRRRGGGTGAAALCGGGGQGDALLFSVPAE